MDGFREDIKDSFIRELGINPIAYDEKRGYDRSKQNFDRSKYKLIENNYIYDNADSIILTLAHNQLKKKRQVHRTFESLYHCLTIHQTGQLLSNYTRKNAKSDLPIATVREYMKRAKRIIIKALSENEQIRQDILKAIKNEWEK